MAMYDNRRAGVPIASIEFSPMPDGNFTFFYLRDGGQAAAVKQLITSPSFGQHVVTETKLNGKPVLGHPGSEIADGHPQPARLDGNDFSPRLPVRKWNLWRVRGTMGTVGQLGQLASALLPVPVFDPIAHKVRREVDYGTLIFAASNLTANGINIAFGAEKTPDVNQLHFLKENLNERIAPHVAPGGNLPATDDDTRYHLREEPEKPHSIGKKFHDFMQRNSVAFGEIGLRYFGSFALAFPITNEHKHFSFKGWKGGVTELSKGNFRGAWDSARNKHSVYSLAGGLTYMTGKTIALMSKIPDPYENKKHTWWDSVREHVTFHASSVIETFAGATIAYDRLNLRHNAAGAIVNKLRLPEWHILGGPRRQGIPARLVRRHRRAALRLGLYHAFLCALRREAARLQRAQGACQRFARQREAGGDPQAARRLRRHH
ncbi:MAG: hypothetical protein WDN72_06380 [Alphaproteobacteria bacterium]